MKPETKERINIQSDERNIRILLDYVVLFESSVFNNNWSYIHNIDGVLTHERIKKINSEFLNVFIEDIAEQIENGTNRDRLNINIPYKLETIYCGDKKYEIIKYD